EKARSLSVTPKCVAFSPDGKYLATGGRDHCVLIWEAPKPRQRNRTKTPSVAERDAWWDALGGDAKDAYKAIQEMTDAPEHATALLKDRVPPAKACDPGIARRFIAQLDSDVFAERQKAELALEKMGEGVVQHLRNVRQSNAGLELRRRVERLLE